MNDVKQEAIAILALAKEYVDPNLEEQYKAAERLLKDLEEVAEQGGYRALNDGISVSISVAGLTWNWGVRIGFGTDNRLQIKNYNETEAKPFPSLKFDPISKRLLLGTAGDNGTTDALTWVVTEIAARLKKSKP